MQDYVHANSTVQLAVFREQVMVARQQAGHLQKDLASALSLDSQVLSRKLRASGRDRLRPQEVKQIVKTLASWDALSTQDEAVSLLRLMSLKADSFSADEWNSPPLSRLEKLPAHAPTLNVSAPDTKRTSRTQTPLPVPLTPLIGRQWTVALVCERLRQKVRLLTLLGTGGVGKTRLSLEVAHQMQQDFADGVFFVSLASLHNATLVPAMVAEVLSLPQAGSRSRPLEQMLQEYLREKHMLLVLDNFEHLLEAAGFVANLLEAAPGIKVLVTSRAVLQLYGEHEVGVPPLDIPPLPFKQNAATSGQYGAIQLFIERARAVVPGFALTDDNASDITEICIRLDGLPLAIELAAARIRLLSPQSLLARLDHRLQVLTSTARNVPARQQTLRDTITWSYRLLSVEEQQLFRLLSVFVGGCTLEAIEAVASGFKVINILDRVSTLVENSLVQQIEQDDGEPRLVLLETIREYALECLQTSGELAAAQQAHTWYYLALAEEAEPHLAEPEQVRWLDRLDSEYENLSAVLRYNMAGGDEKVEHALRLGTALAWFWYVRGHENDGRRWLEWVQAEHQGSAAVRTRAAGALNQAARLAIWRDEYELAQTLSSESLALYREVGDIRGMAWSLYWLGDATQDRSNYAAAHALYEEALALFQQVENQEGSAYTLAALAYGVANQGDFPRACMLAEEALTLFRTRGDKQGILYALVRLIRCLYLSQADSARALVLAQECLALSKEVGYKQGIAAALSYLGLLALQWRDEDRARSNLEEALCLRKELASPWGIARGMYYLASLSMVQHDYATARTYYEECLQRSSAIGDKEFLASCLEGLGAAAVAQGGGEESGSESVWAAQLWGAAEHLREAIGAPMPPVQRAPYEQALSQAHSQVSEQVFRAAWEEGRSMTAKQVLAAQSATKTSASTIGSPAATLATKPVTNAAGLTAREVEVLRLLAQGWTDAQIAEHLIISPRTVNRHTTSLYSKLGVSSRAAATRYAIEHHML